MTAQSSLSLAPIGQKKYRRRLVGMLADGTPIEKLSKELRLLLTLEEMGYHHDGWFIPFAAERGIRIAYDIVACTEEELLSKGFATHHIDGIKRKLRRLKLELRRDPEAEERKKAAQYARRKTRAKQRKEEKRLANAGPLMSISSLSLSFSGERPCRSRNPLAETFFCKAYAEKRMLVDCLNSYCEANAVPRKDILCWNCRQGRNNREDFAQS